VAPETTPQADTKKTPGRLPELVISPADVSRLIRELEAINTTLMQQTLRNGGETKALKASQLLSQTAELNGLNLMQKVDRDRLTQFLHAIKEKSPVMHMSFSADPSAAFLGRLMTWLRREIHPSVLLTVGLQPTIGAGCILRTTNKYFDFSLRQDFAKKRMMLLGQLIPETKKAQS